MTRPLFKYWCEKFVANLPAGQGKGGEPVFLFVDGHASRWTYEGLEHLYENNVIAICLPSHTSIWAQPNDAAQNRAFKNFFGKAVRAWKNGSPDFGGFEAHL